MTPLPNLNGSGWTLLSKEEREALRRSGSTWPKGDHPGYPISGGGK